MKICACGRVESSKWRGNTCNTCYARKWRASEAGKKYTHSLVRQRKNDPSWQEYMKDYEKSRPRRENLHRIPANRYSALKAKARAKNWDTDLTKDEYLELLSRPCHYCGGELNKSGVGLDRVDTKLGYLKNNVVPCCYTCNRFKSNLLSGEEMVEIIAVLKKLRNGVLWQP